MNRKRKIIKSPYESEFLSDEENYYSDDTVVSDYKTYVTTDCPKNHIFEVPPLEPHLNVMSVSAFSNPVKSIRRKKKYRKRKKSRKFKHTEYDNEDEEVYSRKNRKCIFNRNKLKDIKNIPDEDDNLSLEV